jgi:hypothetical protein
MTDDPNQGYWATKRGGLFTSQLLTAKPCNSIGIDGAYYFGEYANVTSSNYFTMFLPIMKVEIANFATKRSSSHHVKTLFLRHK